MAEHKPEHRRGTGNKLYLKRDETWSRVLTDEARLDPYLRRIVSLIEVKDFAQLFLRTGIRPTPGVEQALPLIAQIKLRSGGFEVTDDYLKKLGLQVPPAYFVEAKKNDKLDHATARLTVGPEINRGKTDKLRRALANVINDTHFKRICLPTPLRPSLADSIADIGWPADRIHGGVKVNGNGVVVGIIDDCCALANRNFLRQAGPTSPLESRIQYLWDQSGTPRPAAAGWVTPQGFTYGSELNKASISAAINRPGMVQQDVIREEEIYSYLGYEMTEIASHGTHVMDIAAGSGDAIYATEGIARDSEIIFVQLPPLAIESGAAALSNYIHDGVEYIFNRAASLGMPAVVNISYGGYTGPHDGTSPLEAQIDQLLDIPQAATPGRAVVVSAGNGFEADCHAKGKVAAGALHPPLHWICRPEDPTSNQLEIWYNGNARLELRLATPDSGSVLGPVGLGEHFEIRRQSDQQVVGWIDHQKDAGNGDNKIVVTLNSTSGEDLTTLIGLPVPPPPGNIPLTAPAPSGIWEIRLKNTGTSAAKFHAWIERDESGRGRGRRQQSRFVAKEADPGYSLAGLATGRNTICVGAYNSATHEVCRYSACGPTRDGRSKPEICAPAEELPTGRGVLSASSRKSLPTRMNGTSAAAPVVTGLIALMFQYARDKGVGGLSVNTIRSAIANGARNATTQNGVVLKLNRHQAVDDTRPHKQKDELWKDLIGDGRIDVTETLKLL